MGRNFVSDTSMLFVFIGTTLLAALTPGLAVFLITSNALKKGFGAAWRATIGIEIGNAVYVLASATWPDRIVGGLYTAFHRSALGRSNLSYLSRHPAGHFLFSDALN